MPSSDPTVIPSQDVERRVGAPVERCRAGQGRLQIEQDGAVVEQLGMVGVVGNDRAVLADRRGEGALAAVAGNEVDNPGDGRTDGQQRSDEERWLPRQRAGRLVGRCVSFAT